MQHRIIIVAPLILIALVSCASKGEPHEASLEVRYKHSEDFMWEQAIAELLENWQIDPEGTERQKLKITTKWDTSLHPMGSFGRRRRLVVELEGDLTQGYVVKATEEAEINTEQTNPLVEEEASWEAAEADGSAAESFLWGLHRRLNPPRSWDRDAQR